MDRDMPGTGVYVKASLFPHALFLFPPKIDIDGQTHALSWGTHFFPLDPGKHALRVHTNYAFMPNTVSCSLDVTALQGKQLSVAFSMLPWSACSLRLD